MRRGSPLLSDTLTATSDQSGRRRSDVGRHTHIPSAVNQPKSPIFVLVRESSIPFLGLEPEQAPPRGAALAPALGALGSARDQLDLGLDLVPAADAVRVVRVGVASLMQK